MNQNTLGNVFSFLPLKDRYIVERVCRRWRVASISHTNLMESLTIYKNTNLIYVFNILNRNGICCLKKIKIFINENGILQLIAANCRNLKYFSLDSFSGIQHLENLNCILKNNKLHYIKLNIEIQYINTIIRSICYTELKYIIINNTDIFTNCTWFKILNVKTLKTIDIKNALLYDENFKDIFNHCPNLEYLTIPRNVTDIGIKHIIKCILLESIRLYYCKITDNGLTDIFNNCVNLRQISIIECAKLTDIGFEHINEHIVNIELDNCNITNIGLTNIFIICNRLKQINIKNLNNINHGFTHISENVKIIILHDCNITNAGLNQIFINCIKLIKISIICCNKLTDIGFENIPNSIQSIKLHCCDITIGYEYIFTRCIDLIEIEITNCTNIELKYINWCTVLQNIEIYNCNLTNINLRDISRCTELECFSTSDTSYNVPGLECILEKCKKLKYIYIQNFINFLRTKNLPFAYPYNWTYGYPDVEYGFMKKCKKLNIECYC